MIINHFTLACWPFTCSECLEEFPADSLMMIVDVYPVLRNNPKRLCEACGKLYLESTSGAVR